MQASPQEQRALECALLAAHILLENGAETYRAEDTAMRICQGQGMEEVQVMALPTGVFVTISDGEGVARNAMRRVRKRTVNLSRINDANSVSRRLTQGEISLADATAELKKMQRSQPGGKLRAVACSAVTSGFFAMLFGGGWFDLLVAMGIGLLIQWISSSMKREDHFHFIISLMGGVLIAAIAAGVTALTGYGNMESIIAGSMMPLLPGLAMTNAIRDTMRGDLVSGVARAAEALLVSVALAAGVGAVLGVRVVLGGMGI